MAAKPMRKITKHIVHCSDSPNGDVKDIRVWHKERGWDDVGYHFIIRRDGEIEVGRTLDVVGAHCAGQNADSVGICLIGRDSFTAGQIMALKRVHAMLKRVFPGIGVFGHRDFNPGKTCPIFDVQALLKGSV